MVSTVSLVTNVAAVVTHVDIKSAVVTWADMQADIFLNYNSKNQAITDAAVITESMTWIFARAITDSFTVTDDYTSTLTKPIVGDFVTTSDVESISMNWGVNVADMIYATDIQVDEYTDGPVLNDFLFNGEPFLSRPITVPAVTIT
jgi:hypothetical protein